MPKAKMCLGRLQYETALPPSPRSRLAECGIRVRDDITSSAWFSDVSPGDQWDSIAGYTVSRPFMPMLGD